MASLILEQKHLIMKTFKNFIFIFIPLFGFSQNTTTISGYVTKENLKSHLKGKYLFEKTQLGVPTDSLGYFKILNVKPQITISPLQLLGMSQTIFNAIIKSVGNQEYNFTLIENKKCFKRLQ
jgi:hypothetical protein